MNRRHAVPSCGRSTLRPYKNLEDSGLRKRAGALRAVLRVDGPGWRRVMGE